jgi:hypothetical protein
MNDPVPHGAAWGGESDIADRLLQPLYDADPDGNAVEVPHFKIPWGHVSNQDAADFASAVISTTATMMRFQSRPKSVGGPIDILVLKPGLAQWLQRKETLASQMSKEGYVQGKQRTVIDLGRKK